MSKFATKYRTHTCGELRAEHVSEDEEVTLSGHLATINEDQSFLLRDRYGKTLVRLDDEALPHVTDELGKRNPEDVLQVKGKVTARAEKDDANPTGAVELVASELEVLSESTPLPEGVMDGESVDVEERLRFRQVYLRRKDAQDRIAMRSRIARETRSFLVREGFLEMESPHLFWYDRVATDPEPVPVGNGKAFALPSGPVVLNQYVKGGNLDRFFQLVRITRREDNPGPSHQQEYTGLDINMAYVDVPDFTSAVEKLLVHLWKSVLGKDLKAPFPTMSYAEALENYGTDQPDIRFDLKLGRLDGIAPGRSGRAITLAGGAAKLSAEDLTDLTGVAIDQTENVGSGIAWARVGKGGALEGPAKALFKKQPKKLAELGVKDGDVVITSVHGNEELAQRNLGAVRAALGPKLGLTDDSPNTPVWVHSYPMVFDDEGTIVPRVVVFAQPVDEDTELVLEFEKRDQVRARAFDLIIDGLECASAYIGNCDQDLQRTIWESMFLMGHGDLFRLRAPIESHRFGIAPHGGMNVGFDRLVARMAGVEAIDEVIPFPKTHLCTDPFLEAPGPVPPEAVEDLVADAEKPTYTIDDLTEEVTASDRDDD